MQVPTNKIICGNNVDVLATFPDDCIDLTVTSPPYDDLRTYKGFNFDFEGVAQQLYRVTKTGGVVVWVVGDATINGSETGTSFKQALRFMEIGFRLHDTMIYAKLDYAPKICKRYGDQFEYMFVLSIGAPRAFHPMMIPCKTYGTFRNRAFSNKESGSAIGNRDEVTAVRKTKVGHNIWMMRHANTQYDHPAIFPEKLARDHIISWSNEGDIVLDPFSGSGTTAKMAKETNRKFIGIDCSEEYCEIARKRLSYDIDIAAQAQQLTTEDFNDLII